MVQELKEGEKQYKRWKKKDVDGGGTAAYCGGGSGVCGRQALARSGEGFFAEQRCQSNFISPFLSKAFFRSFVEPQAIFCREESPAAWWQRMREKSMLSSPLLYNQLHRYTIHIDLELKIQIWNIFAQIRLNWRKLLCWCSDLGKSLFNKICQDCLKNHSNATYDNLSTLNMIITYKLSVQNGKKVLALSKILNVITRDIHKYIVQPFPYMFNHFWTLIYVESSLYCLLPCLPQCLEAVLCSTTRPYKSPEQTREPTIYIIAGKYRQVLFA